MPSPPPDSAAHSPAPLADVLGTLRSLTTFSSMTRMHPSPSASEALSDTASQSTTIVLAPLNSAFDALPRKPWEDPAEYAALGQSAYDGEQGHDRANANLRRFVDRHIVVVDGPPSWSDGRRATSLDGRTLWWQRDPAGNRIVMPDAVAVDSVAGRGANGEIWTLRGVLQSQTPRDPSPAHGE